MRTLLTFLAIGLCTSSPLTWAQETSKPAEQSERPNVLFIAVDDLRPQLACYGRTQMKTPHLDQLARRGVLFERAYCMVPTCGASRAAMMTSIRPAPGRFVSYTARADQDTPEATTLNTHFQSNGYTTVSLGKIFHYPADNKQGWSEPPWRPQASEYQDEAAQRLAIAKHRKMYPQRQKVRGLPYESFDAPDDQYRDHHTASKAIDYLDRFAEREEPFFLAVGFFKPHLPFVAPKKYWDLYDESAIQLPANDQAPKDAPSQATHNSGELRAYATIPPRGRLSDRQARKLIHGYYACVSFIDAQVGRLLDTIDRNGQADNTIIVLWGDHGWQLREHGMWNKHSCFETSMHAPLMVAAPGVQGAQRVAALTEFIDVYPSLCELCNIDVPKHVQGQSFVPQLLDPSLPGKPAAVGRFRGGDTIRTDRYRYSEYRQKGGRGAVDGKMLYDHRQDPRETVNIVSKDSLESTVSALSNDLKTVKGK